MRAAAGLLFFVALLALTVAAILANHYSPAHNPASKPDCRDYWDQVYTLECSGGR